MKKNKLVMIVSVLMTVILLAACGSSAPEPVQTEAPQPAGMPNPIHEVDAQGLVEATGIPLPLPEGAEDVEYSYISLTGEAPIAQVHFTLNGARAFLRAQPFAGTEPADISGLYFEWNKSSEIKVSYCNGIAYTNGEAGYASWVDVVPGLLYNLGMSEGASIEKLTELANAVFVPVQGNAEGEDLYAPYYTLVDAIRLNLKDNWQEMSPEDLDVNNIFAYGNRETLGWLMKDLDGDGLDELLLGELTLGEEVGPIYNIFKLEDDGGLRRIVDGWERSRWYLLADGTLVNEGSSGADDSFREAYGFADGELVPVNRAVERDEYLVLPFEPFLG